MKNLPINGNVKAKAQKSYLIKLCERATEKWAINGIERIEKGILFNANQGKRDSTNNKAEVTMDFALKVHKLLPPQPWKPGIHKDIIKELQCTPSEYFDSVKILINEGLCYNQKDGVVFGEDGNVICFDKDRVDSETMGLKDDLN